METSLVNRLQATLLAAATVALFLLAIGNFTQESKFQQPTDGVWWVEAPGGLVAQRVAADSPGAHAGIQVNDLLTDVDETPDHKISDLDHAFYHITVHNLSDLDRALYHVGIYGNANYSITRENLPLEKPVEVIPAPPDRSMQNIFRFIGLVYLAIGIYILLRRWTAPRATHFYLFCLVSFALNALKYTGKFDVLDWGTYWVNISAEALQPALFLHFALSFPEERLTRLRRRWLLPIVYAPVLILVGLWLMAIFEWQATGIIKHHLEQLGTGYDALYYLLASALFLASYRKAGTPLMRQQLKWLTRGSLLAVLPFTFFYAIPFLFDLQVPVVFTRIAGLSLVILPLTFSWAIVRYRLMDTDLIFKRGVAYTLATGLTLGAYFGVSALVAVFVHTRLPQAVREWGLVIAIVLTLQLFDPLKRRIQGWVDRIFDRQRYDYRKALVEFGRGLSSETNLTALLNSIVERLPSALLVERVAIFMEQQGIEQSGPCLELVASHGLPQNFNPRFLDLGFLNFDSDEKHTHIFLENAQQALHLSPSEQQSAAALDLNYYLPCRVQDGVGSRTTAVIGLGRTIGGDFLSSEDVELLESLASYIGIALQNASLYAQLGRQIREFEQLKEFNENIVESINIGILAVDLYDRIESWNAQMEAMYALSRAEAIGQRLSDVFPADLAHALDGFREDSGVHHLYKFRLTTRAGEHRTTNIAVAPLLSREFVSVGRILLVDDITERVSLEAQLSQADKLSSIGLLAAGVAHEINTPLAVISSHAQMLSKQMSGDTKLGPLLDKITQQSFRAAEIANGLLNFSRTSTTEFRDTSLNQVIRDTLSLVEHQMKTAQIALEVELADDLPLISGNPGKLQQVFLNLLLNAKDAMAGGGRLHIKTQANGHVEAIISDTGSGIAPEHLKRIYDPFFTTKSAPKAGDRRGTGLGLSVSYGIIQEHAGKIEVVSSIGAGTTFHLEFPMLRKSVHA
jgi:two-component system, NtrC family, sensor kinase